MAIAHIAFDVDGTLVDTEGLLVDTLDRTLMNMMGTSFPADVLADSCIGRTETYTMEALGIPAEKRARLISRWNELCQEGRDGASEVFDGTAELLDALDARGIPHGIVTTRDAYLLDYDLGAAGLLGRFSPVVTAESTERHKPEPDPLLRYLELTGTAPENCLYVGDTAGDRACAEAAGVAFCLATWGTGRTVDAAGARTVASYEELLAYVDELNGR